jgi:branched-chain amino acid transport system ATP-binding protein
MNPEMQNSQMQLLEVNNLSKAFGGLRAVDNISFALKKGELVAIIGPNGAGKTTLLNLITGIHKPSKGEILLDGARIQNRPAYEISNLGIARSFQNQQLFTNMSVIENVMIARNIHMNSSFLEVMIRTKNVINEEKEAFQSSMETLSLLGLAEKAREVPSSLALKDRIFLSIARALATNPKLLLLDEPVGGLTAKEIGETSKIIVSLQQSGITILFIEHRMELVKGISERVIVMDFGRKLAEGTFSEVAENDQVIKAYLGGAK